MSCSVKGTGCRVCPGMWLAGILLLISIFQSLFLGTSTSERSGQERSSTEVQSDSAR
jgi:hypothetical protein